MISTWGEFIPALDGGNVVLAPWCERTPCEEWVKEQTAPAKAAAAAEEAAAAAAAAAPAGGEAEAAAAAAEPSKGLTGAAKTLCIPFAQPDMAPGRACFCGCGHDAVSWTLWGRSY